MYLRDDMYNRHVLFRLGHAWACKSAIQHVRHFYEYDEYLKAYRFNIRGLYNVYIELQALKKIRLGNETRI